jgi:hypothetical protein
VEDLLDSILLHSTNRCHPEPFLDLVSHVIYPHLLGTLLATEQYPLDLPRVVQAAHAHAHEPDRQVPGRKSVAE